MGKSSPKPPAAPDPQETAAAQAAANKETAIAQSELNMVNQYTPYGSLIYEPRGESSSGTPQYSATQSLSPNLQGLIDQYGSLANQQLGSLSDVLGQPINFDQLGPRPEADPAVRQAQADAMWGRLEPLYERDLDRMETRLATQGITQGSEAYGNAMDDYGRNVNDARLAIDASAGDEMARMYGLGSDSRNRAINEMVMQRQIPMNELAAMMSGSQMASPQYINPPQTQWQPTDVMGAIYGSHNSNMNAYNAQMQQNAANTQGLFGLGGSALGAGAFMFSDRRLKRDITQIGHLPNGLPLYRFRYKWSPAWVIGLMADEVRKVKPWAVVRFGEYDAVNYAEAVV